MDSSRRSGREDLSVPSFVKRGRLYQEDDDREADSSMIPTVARKEERTMGKPMSNNKKSGRKKRGLKIFLIIMLIFSAFAGYATATVQWKMNNTLDLMDQDVHSMLESVDVSNLDLNSNKDIKNILLIGADKRAEWKESGRSDSVMIATLDRKHKKLKLTSMMRDLYVMIPDHGENRFNSAYSLGGVPLVYRTIASNFKIKLDGYVIVDFEAFKSVINTIGGVEIELTDWEHQYLTTAYHKGSVLKLKKGINNMNGAQALAYSRIRQDKQADFGRTQRQRNVLESIFKKIKSMPMSKWLSVAEKILPYISTDLKNQDIIDYMMSIIKMGTTEIHQLRIPVDNSFTNKSIRGMDVLVPDLDKNRNELQNFIFEGVKVKE